tara:strand:- start:1027 stop:1590 length:564 start_codon:yes stop_codon:yes gene_type:complete
MKNTINEEFNEHLNVFKKTKNLSELLEDISKLIVKKLKSGNKLIICGNGGSAADSQHIAAEVVGRFKTNRKALPAIALSTDTSIITAIGNDFGFKNIFKRQVEAISKSGDIFIPISTSGNSENILLAINAAKKNDCITIGFTGTSGGKMKDKCDYIVSVPSDNTARIQEMHIMIFHIICSIIDKSFE